jgi:hypothetical protein
VVVKPDKKVIFKESKEIIYYHVTAERAVVLVNTAKENKEGSTECEYTRANDASRALGLVGCPSPKDFKNILRSYMIKNCTVTKNADISITRKICGPDLAQL